MNRPVLLLFLLLLLHVAIPAAAKDGDSGGSSGSSNSGNGSSNSGSGDNDDNDDDDEDDDDGGFSGGSSGGDRQEDSNRVRNGVSSGEILPLATILRRLESGFDGRLIDARLKQRGARVIYELQIITPKGRVLEVDVDAASARVLNYEVD